MYTGGLVWDPINHQPIRVWNTVQLNKYGGDIWSKNLDFEPEVVGSSQGGTGCGFSSWSFSILSSNFLCRDRMSEQPVPEICMMLGKVASWHQISNPGGWKLTFPTPTLNLWVHIPLIALLPSPHHQHQGVRPIPGPSRWTGRCACDSSTPRCPLHRPQAWRAWLNRAHWGGVPTWSNHAWLGTKTCGFWLHQSSLVMPDQSQKNKWHLFFFHHSKSASGKLLRWGTWQWLACQSYPVLQESSAGLWADGSCNWSKLTFEFQEL